MNLLKNELQIFGSACDATENLFVALDESFCVQFINKFAEQVLLKSNQDSLKGQSFTDYLKKNKHPLFLENCINSELLIPIKLNDYTIRFKVYLGTLDGVKTFFLIGKNITEQENLYLAVEEECRKIMGYDFPKRLTIPRYINEIKNYLTSIINKIPCYVYWKNKNLEYLGCNELGAQFLNLSSSAEIVGKTDLDLFSNKVLAESYREDDRKVLTSKKGIFNQPGELIKSDGELSYTLVSKVPLFNEDNEVLGLVGISLDITELKKMEEHLRQAKIAAEAANHAKSEFLANISHDVRTPLTGIITFSRFLKEQDNLTEAQRKELAGDTYHASEQLLNLLNGVLDVVSADFATDHDVNLTSFNLKQMIDDLIGLEKPAVISHNLELLHSIDKNIPEFIISDKMKLHRILLNLIGNAIKFTEKGSIKLSAKLQSKDRDKITVVFSVEDTGIGIPYDAQSQIFERFYKVNPSYKGKYTGNGIGLNIVQTYLQLLGGKIDFQSTFGKGTTFSVTLTFIIGEEPIDEDSDYKKLLEQEQEAILLEDEIYAFDNPTNPADKSHSALKILLVEDNPIALKSLKMLFIPYQLHVLEALNAEDALEMAKKESFDLIITDIGLPGMQGDELVAKIRQLESQTGRVSAVIAALTGHAVDGVLSENCKKAGVDELFKKPLQPKQLNDLLTPLLKIRLQEEKFAPDPKQELDPQVKPLLSKGGKLGVDLPDTEAQLFKIDTYPLLDLNVGIAILGSEALVKDILTNLYEEGIAPELVNLKKAHAAGDWEVVRELAHKMKGGATFGTVRLYYALLYMERYIKAEHKNCAEDLYAQMLRVIDETVEYLDKYC